MRRALAFLVLALVPFAYGGAFVSSPSAEELATCGTPVRIADTGRGVEYLRHACMGDVGGGNEHWVFYAVEQSTAGTQYRYSRNPHTPGTCWGSLTSSYNNWTYADVTDGVPAFDTQVSTYCEVPAALLVEPEVDELDGWTVMDDFADCPGGIWADRATFWNDESVTYDVSWSTSCGGSFFAYGLTGAEHTAQVDAFEDACAEVCTDPRDDYLTEPVPSDPPEPQECTGVDGLACESTLRDIRELLARQVEAEQPAAPLPFPDQPGEEQTYAPPYDASSPDFEAWTAPDIAETSVSDLVDLIETRAAAVVTAAEGRLPFGLMSWVPDASLEGTATCDNPTWTILRTTEEIGWCDSAPETWLATTGRALSLILATFAFGFAVVRTVAWA